MYTCYVITGDQEPVMEAGVFVDVFPDTDYGNDDMKTQRSPKRISSQEQSGAVQTNTNFINTPDIIDNNEFRADIFLKPAKSINYVTLTFVATRTGISFEEVTGRV